MSYINLLLASSSLEGLKLGKDERRYFALHPKTGKRITPDINVLKKLICDETMEIKNDSR